MRADSRRLSIGSTNIVTEESIDKTQGGETAVSLFRTPVYTGAAAAFDSFRYSFNTQPDRMAKWSSRAGQQNKVLCEAGRSRPLNRTSMFVDNRNGARLTTSKNTTFY
jgi:hypothetical protein